MKGTIKESNVDLLRVVIEEIGEMVFDNIKENCSDHYKAFLFDEITKLVIRNFKE